MVLAMVWYRRSGGEAPIYKALNQDVQNDRYGNYYNDNPNYQNDYYYRP